MYKNHLTKRNDSYQNDTKGMSKNNKIYVNRIVLSTESEFFRK